MVRQKGREELHRIYKREERVAEGFLSNLQGLKHGPIRLFPPAFIN